MERMSSTLFCLVLPGDSASARRTSEIFMAGCIPVFLGPPFGSMPLAEEGGIDYRASSLFYNVFIVGMSLLGRPEALVEYGLERRKRLAKERRSREGNASVEQQESYTRKRMETTYGYYKALEELRRRQKEEAAAIAVKFSKPVDAVLQDLQYQKTYTNSRKPNRRNAWAHFITLDLGGLGEFSSGFLSRRII